jgi:hyperosmotically inducible periplasmic protein
MRNKNLVIRLLAVLLLAAPVMACDAIQGRETAGQYVDDATITTKVIAAIVKEPSLSKLQVSVETLHQVVQLSGFVDTAQNVARAGQLAWAVEGVRSVKNDLVIRQ